MGWPSGSIAKEFPPNGPYQISLRYLALMKGETGERWRALCQQAQTEQDPKKFMELIREITRLLEEKEQRLRGQEKPEPGSSSL